MQKLWEMAQVGGSSVKIFCTNNYGDGQYFLSQTGSQADARGIDVKEVVSLDLEKKLKWKNTGSLLTYSRGQQIPILAESQLQIPSLKLLKMRKFQLMGSLFIILAAGMGGVLGARFGLRGLIFATSIGFGIMVVQYLNLRNYNKELLNLISSETSTSIPAEYRDNIAKKSQSIAWLICLILCIAFVFLGFL